MLWLEGNGFCVFVRAVVVVAATAAVAAASGGLFCTRFAPCAAACWQKIRFLLLLLLFSRFHGTRRVLCPLSDTPTAIGDGSAPSGPGLDCCCCCCCCFRCCPFRAVVLAPPSRWWFQTTRSHAQHRVRSMIPMYDATFFSKVLRRNSEGVTASIQSECTAKSDFHRSPATMNSSQRDEQTDRQTKGD